MGKWNYRRRWTPKNYYRDQRIPSPPTYYDAEFKLRGAWRNVDLPWEERFCISVGIPWEKVINAKKYMHCYDNVVKWDDSASESSFSDAKKRFWAKINDIPTDVPEPDPDMYNNNEIDWNPTIDVELVKDLDLAYFNPDEAEKVEIYNATNRNNDGFAPGCILGLDDKDLSNTGNPWGRNKNDNVNNKTYENNNNNNNNNNSDPWERVITQDDREIRDTWGGGGSSLWHKDVAWKNDATNSWHWNQLNRAPSRQQGNYRGNSFGRGRWHGQHDGQRHNGNGWESNVSCRKREGSSQQYTTSYKSARVQSDDYREGNWYRR